MSATTSESSSGTSQRISWRAIASCLCGVGALIVGLFVWSDAGSDISDLLTLTLPLFLVAAVVLYILSLRAGEISLKWLRSIRFFEAGGVLVVVTIISLGLLIPQV
jgi:hypothetical protein